MGCSVKDLSNREGIEVVCKSQKELELTCMNPSEKKFDAST